MKKFYFVLLMILLVYSVSAALTYSFDKIADNETGFRVEPTQFTMMMQAESSSKFLISFINPGLLMSSIPEPATLFILSVGMLLTKQPRRNKIS